MRKSYIAPYRPRSMPCMLPPAKKVRACRQSTGESPIDSLLPDLKAEVSAPKSGSRNFVPRSLADVGKFISKICMGLFKCVVLALCGAGAVVWVVCMAFVWGWEALKFIAGTFICLAFLSFLYNFAIGFFVALFIVVLSSAPAMAMAVSDTTSYTYYVEQLKKQAENIEKLQEQLEEAKKILNETQQIKKSVESLYIDASSIQKVISNFQSNIQKNPLEIGKYTHKWNNKDEEENFWVNVKEITDRVFRDATDMENGKRNYLEQRDVQQRTIKDAIDESGRIIAAAERKGKIIEEFLEDLKSPTKNATVKHAVDINSNILLAVLTALEEMLQLQAKFFGSQSFIFYEGVTDAMTEKNIQIQQTERELLKQQNSKVARELREFACEHENVF